VKLSVLCPERGLSVAPSAGPLPSCFPLTLPHATFMNPMSFSHSDGSLANLVEQGSPTKGDFSAPNTPPLFVSADSKPTFFFLTSFPPPPFPPFNFFRSVVPVFFYNSSNFFLCSRCCEYSLDFLSPHRLYLVSPMPAAFSFRVSEN